jgi:hypothetical protein
MRDSHGFHDDESRLQRGNHFRRGGLIRAAAGEIDQRQISVLTSAASFSSTLNKFSSRASTSGEAAKSGMVFSVYHQYVPSLIYFCALSK